MKKCSLCGKEKHHDSFYKDKRGIYSARCKSCHGVANRDCVCCGRTFVGKAGAKLCSDECKAAHRPQTFKRCQCCGETFGPVERLSRKYCSQACKIKSQTTGQKRKFVATPEARSANRKIAYAIQTGKISRAQKCEECGAVGKTEAAHFDYSRPMDVRWLCRSCHVRWDLMQPKGGGKSIQI